MYRPALASALGRPPGSSNVEAEVHDIGFLYQVLLALEPQPAGLPRPGLAVVADVVVEGNDLGTNEAALEIGVDHPGSLRGGTASAHRPGADLLRPGGEICNQSQQFIGGAYHAVQPRLGQSEIAQELDPIGLRQPRDFGF